MSAVEVKFGPWIEEGSNLFKANIGLLVLAYLLAGLVSAVSLGLLAIPLMGGVLMIATRLKEGSAPLPTAGDVFKGFEFFGQGLLLGVLYIAAALVVSLVNLIPCIGSLIAIAAFLALAPIFVFGLCGVALRRLPAIEAIKDGLAIAKMDYLKMVLFCLVAQAIGSAGGLLCGVGALFTMPITLCILATAYRDIQAQRASPPLAQAPLA